MSFLRPRRPLQLLAVFAAPLLLGPSPAMAQSPGAPAETTEQLAAVELWEKTCSATLLRRSRDAKAVTALDLDFGLLTRGAEGSNEVRARVRWLSANNLIVQLNSGREYGRGPEGDWLREGDEVKRLAGREYIEDRRQIDQYLIVVKNFAALTNPQTLKLEQLSIVKQLPFGFPKRHVLDLARNRKKLTWLSFMSSGLQLPGETPRPGLAPEKHLIFLAVDNTSHLPIMAMVTDARGTRVPMFLSLSEAKALDDLKVPRRIHVYEITGTPPGSPKPLLVAELPSQELDIKSGTVRPKLTEKDFELP